MAKSKALSLLGLAKRAHQLIDGEERVLKACKTKTIKLIVLASDAGENITKKMKQKAHFYTIPLIDDFTKTEITQAIGQLRTVVAITDSGFARAIHNALNP